MEVNPIEVKALEIGTKITSSNHEGCDIDSKKQWKESSIKLIVAGFPAKHHCQRRKISTTMTIQDMVESLRALTTENTSL